MTRPGPAARLALRAAFAASLLFVLVACGGTGNRDASPVATGSVVMQDSQFQPPHIEVPARTTVTWTNASHDQHDVKFDDGPQSSILVFGATYQRVFDSPGVFDYVCTIHPGMVGRVTVTAR
jgi:plastocyanin